MNFPDYRESRSQQSRPLKTIVSIWAWNGQKCSRGYFDVIRLCLFPKYSRPEMSAIWMDESRMATWLEVEIAVCEAWAERGLIPAEALAQIKEKAAFDVARVLEIEQETRHDVIAFLTNVGEHVGEASKYIHYGMTSSDMLDTGLGLQLKAASDILLLDLRHLPGVLQKRAFEHRDTIMIGRSHGIHAEPITF